MKQSQQKIYNQALSILALRFGRGSIQRVADHYGVSRQMVSATLNGNAHNPSLRRKMKKDFGVVCVPFAPISPLKRKKKFSTRKQTAKDRVLRRAA